MHRIITWILLLGMTLAANSALAYDCSGLPEWKRQHYYLPGEQVQYQGSAYENTSTSGSKRDFPDQGEPWTLLDECTSSGAGGDPGGGGGGGNVDPQPISVYGVWHCGNDYCTWSAAPDMVEFDQENHWLIDRGNASHDPSVNLVVLSFVHPLRLLHGTTDSQTVDGVPRGMNQAVVNYFKSHGIRVMLSIGGITYVDPWNQALAEDATQLGLAAAGVAQSLGVGIEIDYEENRNPDLDGLQQFISAYRSIHPYDASGANPAARLTIDLAAGDRWLIALTERATAQWLRTDAPALDYANAMVPARQPNVDSAIANWQEHVDGKPNYDPPILPLAPARFTGSLWLTGRKPLPECVDFSNSLQNATGDFVQTVLPSPDLPDASLLSNGMLGFMFWAAGCEGTRSACTTPEFNNTCEGGIGVGATWYSVPIPMPPLRQE